MTDIIKVIDILPDEAKHLAQKLHRKKEDIEVYRKALVGDIESSDEERTIVARVSTNDRDRDGEIVEPKGIDLKDFQANPVLLWAHRYEQPPVGKALWSKTDEKGMVCKFRFAETQFAEDIYQLYKGGYLRAFSIGFIPLDFDAKTKTFNKVSILEVSAVPVPANQGALVMDAYAKGIVTSDALKADLGIAEPAVEAPEAEAVEAPTIDPEIFLTKADVEKAADIILEAARKQITLVEAEEKTLDLKGNPSVYDIMSALYMTLNPAQEVGDPNPAPPWTEVIDLYPYDYPSGACVTHKRVDDMPVIEQCRYKYADGKATIVGEPTPVAQGYVRRGIDSTQAVRDLALQMNLLIKRFDEFEGKAVATAIVEAVSEPEVEAASEVVRDAIAPPDKTYGTITITPAAPAPKSDAQVVLDYLKSPAFKEQVALMVDKSIGRVR